ncbi:MAG: putative nucleotidyltransferase substrate binding domain-containing protein [Sulfurimonas sp.]|nr:putative nucleotidyltransferase substrate binding domain-containing protein [Sulfurimonas sp.]
MLSFETHSPFFEFCTSKEYNNKLDLKKVVYLLLSIACEFLSLEYHITQINTIERIKELNNRNIIDKKFATELIESFDTLLSIRLKSMLESKELSEETI